MANTGQKLCCDELNRVLEDRAILAEKPAGTAGWLECLFGQLEYPSLYKVGIFGRIWRTRSLGTPFLLNLPIPVLRS